MAAVLNKHVKEEGLGFVNDCMGYLEKPLHDVSWDFYTPFSRKTVRFGDLNFCYHWFSLIHQATACLRHLKSSVTSFPWLLPSLRLLVVELAAPQPEDYLDHDLVAIRPGSTGLKTAGCQTGADAASETLWMPAWKTGETICRWFTATQTGTLISGMTAESRRGQKRGETTEQQEWVRQHI